MPDTLIYQRPLRALESWAASIFQASGHDNVPRACLEHIGLLIMCLQTMSSIVTFMLGDKHDFYTPLKDKGLDSNNLMKCLPDELIRNAKKPGNQKHAFWHSSTIEEQYWGLLLRCMLDADEATWERPRPGHIIAMSLRFHTVGPVARRLLGLINDVLEKCSPHNLVIEAVRLRLHSFLREPIERGVHDDLDPHDVIARGLHNRHFAGTRQGLSKSSRQRFKTIEAEMIKEFGEDVTMVVTAAAEKAGLKHDLNYATTGADDDGSDNVSVSNLPSGGDCGRLLLAQLPLFKQLDDLLYHLATVNEESLFTKIIEADEDTHADEIFFRPVTEEAVETP